jgi:hypothetical protein
MHIYDRISLASSYNEKCFTQFIQKIKTNISCSIPFFFFFCRLWDNVEKYCRIEQVTDDNVVMHIGCWIPKATNKPSECIILIAFPLQQWLHHRVFVLRYTYIVYFVVFPFLMPCAVRTETSGRYISSNDIKCIKSTKKPFISVHCVPNFWFSEVTRNFAVDTGHQVLQGKDA